jgi:hypothetical protein
LVHHMSSRKSTWRLLLATRFEVKAEAYVVIEDDQGLRHHLGKAAAGNESMTSIAAATRNHFVPPKGLSS